MRTIRQVAFGSPEVLKVVEIADPVHAAEISTESPGFSGYR
jgi:hypothetical protein